jgi:hypothetical protein
MELARVEQRPLLREEAVPGDATVVVRGGPGSLEKCDFTHREPHDSGT